MCFIILAGESVSTNKCGPPGCGAIIGDINSITWTVNPLCMRFLLKWEKSFFSHTDEMWPHFITRSKIKCDQIFFFLNAHPIEQNLHKYFHCPSYLIGMVS